MMVGTMHVGLGGILQGYQITLYNRLLSEGRPQEEAFREAKRSRLEPPAGVQELYVKVLPSKAVQEGFWARVWRLIRR